MVEMGREKRLLPTCASASPDGREVELFADSRPQDIINVARYVVHAGLLYIDRPDSFLRSGRHYR